MGEMLYKNNIYQKNKYYGKYLNIYHYYLGCLLLKKKFYSLKTQTAL